MQGAKAVKTDLRLVPQAKPATVPYDEARGIRRITIIRNQLMSACVRYVREGKSGKLQDRVREASDWSGVPRNLIEVALRAPGA